MSHSAFLACLALSALLVGCGLTEVKQRRATLEALVRTNAPLSAVESAIGRLPIYKRGSTEWDATRRTYARYSYPSYRRVLSKIDRSAAFGMTSTPTMMTYIFLDEQNRLIDFEADVQ
jgi:hypothetical protein